MSSTVPMWPVGGPEPAAPGLLVPVQVDALPITAPAYLGDWSWTPPSYGQLRTLLPIDPAPFTAQKPTFPTQTQFVGTVVSWALPDALTHGVEQDGHVDYPATPNRWLVVRRAPTSTRAAWADQAWVVASDYLNAPLGSPWPNSTATGAAQLGMSWTIETWPGEAEVAKHALNPPLTAIGAGEATFAAFVPNVGNVFAFADPMIGVTAGPLNYTVLGWYAAPVVDPLRGTTVYGPGGWQTTAQWHDLMDRLRWSTGGAADLADSVLAAANWAAAHGQTADPDKPRTCYPARTLCHGSTQQVVWSGPNAPFLSGVPTSNPNLPTYRAPKVAVGDSAGDALTTMVAQLESDGGLDQTVVEEFTEILQAFQLGDLTLLDSADGPARLAIGEQAGWFDNTNGGTRWEVVDPRDSEQPTGRRAGAPLDSDQAALLTDANQAQQHLDQLAATLASLQWQRYGLWWKTKRLNNTIPPPKQRDTWMKAIQDAIITVDATIEAQVLAFRWWRRQRDEALVTLVPDLVPLTVIAGTQPPYQRPSNPVILVSGAGRAYRHGADGRFDPDGKLRCRFTGQAVFGLTVTVGQQTVPVTGPDLPPAAPTNPDLPAEASDLLTEAVVLDIDSAPQIAASAAAQTGSNDPWALLQSIRTDQTAIWQNTLTGDHTATVDSALIFQYDLGAVPSKVAVQFWKPPWAPLFLDWSFDFTPSFVDTRTALGDWQFPGEGSSPAAELSYSWTGGSVSLARKLALQGRTLLTPQTGEVFAARLEKYVADYAANPTVLADLWALTDAADYLHHADLLSQATTGFNLSLLQRDPSAFPLPSDQSLDPYLDPPGAPALIPDSFPVPGVPAANPNPFNPIRAGHAKLTQLWVVDMYGQVFKILDPGGGALPPTAGPELAPDLVTASDPSMIEFKPRLTQFARLQLAWLSAVDDTVTTSVTAGADPVCGWVIPNRLEQSLLCYSADGTPLGELMISGTNAVWCPVPTQSAPPHGPAQVDIDNIHLRAMIDGIVARAQSGAALTALLGLIDTAMWTIEPSGGWADEELPVLIGRPLAVVRAALTFDVQGLPAYSQAWDDTDGNATYDFDQVPFPARLGSAELLDDGLIGYYLNDNYSQVQTVYTPEASSPYIGDQMPALPLGATALLTLLLDPRTNVHVSNGILPVTSVTLPDEFATPALTTMAVLFRSGPLLNDPAVPSLPLPGLHNGTWSWVQYVDTEHPARESAIAPADPTATLPDNPLVIREGWLELLLGEPSTTLTYAGRPTSVGATTTPDAPTVTQIDLTAYNGTQSHVACHQIAFTVPVGNGTGHLTTNPATIAATVQKDSPWQIRGDGAGTFTATPVGDSLVPPGETLNFTLSGLQVSPTPGVGAITIHEQTDTIRSTSIDVAKTTVRPSSQLSYTIDPFQITVTPGDPLSFTITGYNGGPSPVELTRLVFTVPVGSGPADLTPTVTGLQLLPTAGTAWTITPDGQGGFVGFPNPSPARLDPGESLAFSLTGVTRPSQDGRALIVVIEAGDDQFVVSTPVTKSSDTGQPGDTPAAASPEVEG